MKVYIVAACIALIVFSIGAFAVGTSDKQIDEIGIQGNSPDEIVITNFSGWGAAGCESAKYAVLGAGVNNRQEMLSLILAAKLANQKIRLYGNCDTSNSDRFNATYVVLK